MVAIKPNYLEVYGRQKGELTFDLESVGVNVNFRALAKSF